VAFTISQNIYGPLIYLAPDADETLRDPPKVTLLWKGSGYLDGEIRYRVVCVGDGVSIDEETANTFKEIPFPHQDEPASYSWYIFSIHDGVPGTSSGTRYFRVVQ
jgi:hypothetical protein